MLKTQRTFSDNVLNFYVDDEITSFLSAKKSLTPIYEALVEASGQAAVYPLVLPTSENDYSFDLIMIIKHEKVTEEGQWELYVAEDFVKQETNLAAMFSYIEQATNTDTRFLIQAIQQTIKQYRERFNLPGKSFVDIDAEDEIIVFGCIEQ